jgi:hypothetical protein
VKRRTWVLDTSTKGTGAQMVPLESVLEKPKPSSEPLFVPPKPAPRAPRPPEPRVPRRFKIVDVVSREVLAEGVSAREALAVLKDVRSNVDVRVYVRQPKADRWRLLTLDEQRLLWDRRDFAGDPSSHANAGTGRGAA